MFKKMLFSNAQQPQRSAPNMSAYSANVARAPVKPVALNAPMVNRVHAAKPGCSACGKRVA